MSTVQPPGGVAQPTVAPQVSLVVGAVFLVFLGQMTLNPIIAPLSREAGLAEWQVGVTISAAAIMLVLTAQRWGRLSQSWGRKPVLVAAFALATISTALFAATAQLAMSGALTGLAVFVLFVVFRGVGFGTAIAAVPPTAQAYVADVTPDEQTRVKGMSGIGAASGVAMIAGSALGGALAGLGLMAPLLAVPALLGAGLVVLAVRLRREPRGMLIDNPARVRPTDPRVWPFLLAGFGMLTALGFIQILIGFVVQDRLGLEPDSTGAVTGAALLAAGVGLVLAQAVLVPRSRWSPPTLLRIGSGVAALGFLVMTPDLGAAPLFAGITLIGVGLGIAMPGYTAGPSLLVERSEQGALAGLIMANNGLTFVVAPTASTLLYALWQPLPMVTGLVLMTSVTVLSLTHPRLRLDADRRAVEPSGRR